jgi:hypothetical protein
MFIPAVPACSAGVSSTAVQDEFLAMVCADEAWLRAEFDAIVREEWSVPPRPRPKRFVSGHDRSRLRASGNSQVRSDQLRYPTDGWVRQRSPPLGFVMQAPASWK